MTHKYIYSFFVLPLTANAATPIDTSRVYNIEEVVIVASPKETTFLMRQPISATLMGKHDLQSVGANDVSGLSAAAPNVFLPAYGSRVTSSGYIRGVGSRIGAPAVGLYVDNTPYINRSSYDFSFLDVDRVDILRGPQGTLYGGGSMGGLIRVFTADPFTHHGTDVALKGSTRNSGREAKAVTYLHPSERVALSVGGFYTGNNGFYRNTTTGQKADGEDAGGGKVRLAYRPSDALRLDLAASYEYSDEEACPYFFAGPVTHSARPMSGIGEIGQNRQSRYRRSLLNTSLGLTWDAPRFSLSSITSVQHLRDRFMMDQDFLREDIFSLVQRQRMNNFTEEVTAKGSRRNRWQWVTGAFVRHQQEHTSCPVTFHNDGLAFLNGQFATVLPQKPPMSLTFTDDNLSFTSAMETPSTGAALYHQSTVSIGAGVSVTAGLRLEYDYRSLNLTSGLNPAANYRFAMPSFHIDAALTGQADVNGKISTDTWQLLPKMALQYEHRSGRGNVYLAVSKGYRPGGYNLQSYSDLGQMALRRDVMSGVKDYSINTIDALPLPDAAKNNAKAALIAALEPNIPAAPDIRELAYKAEEAWNYELGGHLRFRDGALRVDYTVFCVDTKNRQLARFADSGLGRVTVNAGRSRSIGTEVTLRGSHLDNRLTWTLAYGYTHAELTRHNLGKKDGVDVDYTGNRVPFAPEHTLFAEVTYRQPLRHHWWRTVYMGANTQAAGRIYWDEANTFSQPFYALLNARVGVEMGGHIEAELRGNNLAGTKFAAFSFDSMGHRFEQYGAARHFELTLRFHW